MKVCPNCRHFYDDPLLEFCIEDGAMLAPVFEPDELWNEGTRELGLEAKRVRRISQIQMIKKILIYTVSLGIFSAVIFVVVMNVVMLLNPQETPPFTNNTVAAGPNMDNSNQAGESNDANVENSNGFENKEQTNTVQEVTPKPGPLPAVLPACSSEDAEKHLILAANQDRWQQDVKKKRMERVKVLIGREPTAPEMEGQERLKHNISVSPECSKAGVDLNYGVKYTIQGLEKSAAAGRLRYSCTKFEDWVCDLKVE